MKYLIRYSPEINLKSKVVRRRMARRLASNLRRRLRHRNRNAQLTPYWDKIILQTAEDSPQVNFILENTPGIGYSIAFEEYAVNMDDKVLFLEKIAAAAGKAYAERLPHKTFSVRCRCRGELPARSMEIEAHVGERLRTQTEGAGVRLRNPQVEVRLEVEGGRLFVEQERYPGLGGFPLGEAGFALGLFSAGFDSTVAAGELLRRGVLTHLCHFRLAGDDGVRRVLTIAESLWSRFAQKQRLYLIVVPFERVLEEILRKVPASYRALVLKRMMLRAAEKVAERLHVDALFTGESISQVSSQTLANLCVIDRATGKLVLRPLASWDKAAIIKRAHALGLNKHCEKIREHCAVVSRQPRTCAEEKKVENCESYCAPEFLDGAVAQACFHPLWTERAPGREAEISSVPERSVVIDLRAEIGGNAPQGTHNVEVLHIPYYLVGERFSQLPRDRQYLLYCDYGSISHMQLSYLRKLGYQNVQVYRPA